MAKKQLYLQLISNILIPILGFWVWNWSLYFIVLFFLLDLISAEIVHFFKIKKIKESQQISEKLKQTPTKTYAFMSLLFVGLTIVLINGGMVLYKPEIQLGNAFWEFLTYKEMGIPQGIILIPLVIVTAYTQFRMEFVVPRLFNIQQEKPLWKAHLKAHFILLSFCCMLIFIATVYQFPEWVVMVIVLICITLYNYLQGLERIKQKGIR